MGTVSSSFFLHNGRLKITHNFVLFPSWPRLSQSLNGAGRAANRSTDSLGSPCCGWNQPGKGLNLFKWQTRRLVLIADSKKPSHDQKPYPTVATSQARAVVANLAVFTQRKFPLELTGICVNKDWISADSQPSPTRLFSWQHPIQINGVTCSRITQGNDGRGRGRTQITWVTARFLDAKKSKILRRQKCWRILRNENH